MTNVLRRIAERASRGVIIKRRLPASVGGANIYVSPDSQLKYLKLGRDAFDTALLRLAQTYVKRDWVVWDVGANVGVFTFAAAGVAAGVQVLAIEPDIWLAQLLHRSRALGENRSLNVKVLSAAIAQRNGVSEFAIAMRGRASNYLPSANGLTQAGGAREVVEVATLTLDTLLDSFTAPTFLKVDVEGAEILVLRGAHKLLSEVRPMMYIEVGEQNADEVAEILARYRYGVFDSTKPLLNQVKLARCPYDALAVPDS